MRDRGRSLARRLLLRWGLTALGLTTLSFTGGCQSQESEPVAVARAFANSARRGDVEAMLALIEAAALERVHDAAETASDQVGGRRSIEAKEMLQIVGVDRTVAVAKAELIDDDGRVAHVELTMTDGESIRLELVREPSEADPDADPDADATGAWKVRLPLPSARPEAIEPLEPSPPDA
jgi:hypothetical protein